MRKLPWTAKYHVEEKIYIQNLETPEAIGKKRLRIVMELSHMLLSVEHKKPMRQRSVSQKQRLEAASVAPPVNRRKTAKLASYVS